MELLISLCIGVLGAGGVYLLLRPRSFEVVLGLTLLSYAINLMIFAMGRVSIDRAPILSEGVPATLAHYADPLPQALVLTAIVISFAMTAVLIVLVMRAHAELGSDRIDADSNRDSDLETGDR